MADSNDQPNEAADVGPGAPEEDQFLRALPSWDLQRYDYEAILDVETFRVEEVYLFLRRTDFALPLLPLPPRKSSLQLNFRATDASGKNLPILTRHMEDDLSRLAVEIAIAWLREQKDKPAWFDEMVGPDWKKLFPELWVARLKQDSSLMKYLIRKLAVASDDSNELLALMFLIDKTMLAAKGDYRPWLFLGETAPKNDLILVKYCVENTMAFRLHERFLQGLLGWAVNETDLPWFALGASTHYRFRPPDGLVFANPISWPPWLSQGQAWTNQVQMYLSKTDADRIQPDTVETSFRVRATQTASTRILVAALYGTIFFGSIVLAAADNSIRWTIPFPLSESWNYFVAGLERAPLVSAKNALDASVMALPLALGLVSVAWEKPGVRFFAAMQLVTAILSVLLLMAGATNSLFLWIGLVLSLGLFTYNLGELMALIPGIKPFVRPRDPPNRTI